jgi:hypothetical protein
MLRRIAVLTVALAAASLSWAQSPTLLVSQYNLCPSAQCGGDYYGGSTWTGTTNAINAAFGASSVTISSASRLENVGNLSGYTSLWIDLRAEGSSLSADDPAEFAALQSYIAAGHRVVLIGANYFWIPWDNSLLSLVGTSYSTYVTNGLTPLTPAIPCDSLTAGITNIIPGAGGLATGGTWLFNQGLVVIGGPNSNVLVIQSGVTLDDETAVGAAAGNMVFKTNVARWLAGAPYTNSCTTPTGPVVTPIPTLSGLGLALLAIALMGAAVALLGRRRNPNLG